MLVTAICIRTAEPDEADDEDLRSLLADANDRTRLTGLVNTALAHGVCLLAIDGDERIGCVCVLPTDEAGECVLRAIAIKAAHRRAGVGRRLVQEAIARSDAAMVHAETDNDAVDFYSRLGFSVTSLGEKYPGVERFACSRLVSTS